MANRDSQSISTTLLSAAQARNQDAWLRLDTMFRPIVFHWFCKRWHVTHATAEDLVQNVLLRALSGLGTFQRTHQRQSFTGWMWTIAKHEAADYFRRQAQTQAASGGTAHQLLLAELPEAPPQDDEQDAQLKLSRLLELVERDFSGSTRTIFERVIVGGEPTAEVAADLGMKNSAVREAKRRVIKRLREEWTLLFGEWPFNQVNERLS